MAAVGGLLGMGGGASGSGFAAPSGVSGPDLARAEEQQQHALAQQQAFTGALNPGALQATQSQQDLLAQLGQGAQGLGPNPALQQLQNTTGQNVANQAALMAGQRGSSANTGLMARQIANQGANTQQQAAGQAAVMAQNRQLQQQQALQAQQQAMVNQNQAGLNAYNQFANTHQGNLLGMQGNINSNNATLTGHSMGGQQNMIGNMMGAVGSAGNLFGGKGGSAASANDLIGAGGEGEVGMDALGGASEAGGSAAGLLSDGSMLAADGGMIPKMAQGGDPLIAAPTVQGVQAVADPSQQGPQSNVGKMLMDSGPKAAPKASGGGGGVNPMNMLGGAAGMVGGVGNEVFGNPNGDSGGGLLSNFGQNVANMYTRPGKLTGFLGQDVAKAGPKGFGLAEGGKVPVLLSPGERVLSPDKAKQAAQGQANPMAEGKKVPGKPKVGGAKNDYANDTVKDQLEPGSIVIPRSVSQGKNAEKESIKFVRAIMARKGQGLKR